MLWVLWDILLPVLLAFFSGLLIGWLLWRWRRRAFDNESVQTMRRDNARYRSDIQQLRARNAQLAERPQMPGVTLSSESSELMQLRERNAMLKAELTQSREQLQNEREAPIKATSTYQTASSHLASAKGITERARLQETIEVRDKMIATLQRSLEQYGDQKDLIALSAELAMRDRKIDALENLLDQVRR